MNLEGFAVSKNVDEPIIKVVKNNAYIFSVPIRVGFVNGQHLGLHARPAAQIVKFCSQYDADVFLAHYKKPSAKLSQSDSWNEILNPHEKFSAKSIMGLLSGEFPYGKLVNILVKGTGNKREDPIEIAHRVYMGITTPDSDEPNFDRIPYRRIE